MTSILIAGALLHLALTASLVFGVLHYVQAKVKPIMATLDLLAEIKTLVADLKALDFPAFVSQLKADAMGAETAIEGELQTLVDDIKGVIADVTAAKAAAPADPATAETPAA